MCLRIHKVVFIWFWNKINFTTCIILAGKSHKSGQILNSPYDSDKTFSYSPFLRFYIVFGQNWWTPSWWLKFPPLNQGVPIWNDTGCGRVSGFLKRGELELRSSLCLLLSQTQFHNKKTIVLKSRVLMSFFFNLTTMGMDANTLVVTPVATFAST